MSGASTEFGYYEELLARYDGQEDLQKNKRKIPESQWSIVVFLLQLKLKLDNGTNRTNECAKPYEGSGKLEKTARFFSSIFKAKRLYTYIKFYDKEEKWYSGVNFYNFVKLIFGDLNKICGFDPSTADAKVTDEYKIKKIQERIRNELDIDSSDSRKIFADILSKDVEPKVSKVKEELIEKKVESIKNSFFPSSAASGTAVPSAAALGTAGPVTKSIDDYSKDLIGLLDAIDKKFTIDDTNNCKDFIIMSEDDKKKLNPQTLNENFDNCRIFLLKYIDALKTDKNDLKDDDTKPFYERLNTLNKEHNINVDGHKKSLSGIYPNIFVFTIDDNTFAKIDVIQSDALKQFYKDEKELETIIKKLKVDFPDKPDFFNSYKAFKSDKSSLNKRLGFAEASYKFLTEVLKNDCEEISKKLTSKTYNHNEQKVKDAIKAGKDLFGKYGNEKNILKYIDECYKPLSNCKKELLELENVVKTISSVHFTQNYGLLLPTKLTKIEDNFVKIKIITTDKYAAAASTTPHTTDDLEQENKNVDGKISTAQNFVSWQDFCSTFKKLLTDIHERIHTSKVLWKLQCEKYLDENADDEKIVTGYEDFKRCIETNYFEKIKKDVVRYNQGYTYNIDNNYTLLWNLQKVLDEHIGNVTKFYSVVPTSTGSTPPKKHVKFKYLIPEELENFLKDVYGRGGKTEFVDMLLYLEVTYSIIKKDDFTDEELKGLGNATDENTVSVKMYLNEIVSDELDKPKFNKDKLKAIVEKINNQLIEIIEVIYELDGTTQAINAHLKTPGLMDEIEKHLKNIGDKRKIISKSDIDKEKTNVFKKLYEITGANPDWKPNWDRFCDNILKLFDDLNGEKPVSEKKWFGQCKDYLKKDKPPIKIKKEFEDFQDCVLKNYSIPKDSDATLESILTKLTEKLKELRDQKTANAHITQAANDLKNQENVAKEFFGLTSIFGSNIDKFLGECEANHVAPKTSGIIDIYNMAKKVFPSISKFTNVNVFFKHVSDHVKTKYGFGQKEFQKILQDTKCKTYSLEILSDTTKETAFVECINNFYNTQFTADQELYNNVTKETTRILLKEMLKANVTPFTYEDAIQVLTALNQNGYFIKVVPNNQQLINNFIASNPDEVKKKLEEVYNAQVAIQLQPDKIPDTLYGVYEKIFGLADEELKKYETFEKLIGLTRELWSNLETVDAIKWNGDPASLSANINGKIDYLTSIFEKQKEFAKCTNIAEQAVSNNLQNLWKQIAPRMQSCCGFQDNFFKTIDVVNAQLQQEKNDTESKRKDDIKRNFLVNFNVIITDLNSDYSNLYDKMKDLLTNIQNIDPNEVLPIFPGKDDFDNVEKFGGGDYNKYVEFLRKMGGNDYNNLPYYPRLENSYNYYLSNKAQKQKIQNEQQALSQATNNELIKTNSNDPKGELEEFYEKITGQKLAQGMSIDEMVKSVQTALNTFVNNVKATRPDFISVIKSSVPNLEITVIPTLTNVLPIFDKNHPDLLNYWKTVSASNDIKEIFNNFKYEYYEFENHILQTVYGVTDPSVKELFSSFLMLCAVLEKVIKMFGNIDVHNTIYAYYKKNIISTGCTEVEQIKESKLNDGIIDTQMHIYFRDMLSSCLSQEEKDNISIITNSDVKKSIFLISFYHYYFLKSVFQSGRMFYYDFTFDRFLKEIANEVTSQGNNRGFTIKTAVENVIKSYNLFESDQKTQLKVPFDYDGEHKYVKDALTKIAIKQKTSGGSLAPEIIKKPNPIKNAQTKKNKGLRTRRRIERRNRKQTRRVKRGSRRQQ